MRLHLLRRLQQLFALVSVLLIGLVIILIGQSIGLLPSNLGTYVAETWFPPAPPDVALISGHAGYDSGAVCTDEKGQTTVTEASVNANVASLVQMRLRRAGMNVILLDEYDARLAGLVAGVVLSLHADSCVPLSGYKAATPPQSATPQVEARLLACIDQHYANATDLAPHLDTITHDMTDYHAFRKVEDQTPIAILELGFLGGDQRLLTDNVEVVAEGVAESLRCFLRGEKTSKE